MPAADELVHGRPMRRAVPREMRAALVAVIGIAAAVFAALAVRYGGESEPGRFDQRAESVIDTAGRHRYGITRLVADIGPLQMVIVVAVLAALCLALGRWRLAVVAIAGPGLTGVATTVLKPLVGRTFDGAYAYPSGHTGAATSVAIVVGLIVVALWLPDRFAGILVVGGFAVIAGAGMAYALVTNNFHYPTDTIGGFCAALVVVLGTALIVDRLAELRTRPA